MFGEYSYYHITRSIESVFGSLFNNIYVVRKNASDEVLNQEKVAISRASRQKTLARINEDPNLNDTRLAIKLPRMSYNITNLSYDKTRQINKHCKDRITIATSGDVDQSAKFASGAPYNISFELNIYTKTQDDMYQIVEQIIPHFKPSYSVTIKPISNHPNIKQNVKFILNNISINDTFEGAVRDRKILIYTLSFDVKTTYYGPISDSEVIKTAIVNIKDSENTDELIQKTTYAVNPQSATEDDSYTIDITQEFGDD